MTDSEIMEEQLESMSCYGHDTSTNSLKPIIDIMEVHTASRFCFGVIQIVREIINE